MSFLHGCEVVEVSSGARTVKTVSSSVIGVVGTAPDADPLQFPLNVPVMVAGANGVPAGLGASGTLPDAFDGITDQVSAVVVAIRVEEGADDAETISNIIGGVSADGRNLGIKVLLDSASVTGQKPKIIIIPTYSAQLAVSTEMEAIADRLRAIYVVEGPGTTEAAAFAYRENFGSKRFYMVDPPVKVWDTVTSTEVDRPNSPRVAGRIAKTDNDKGFWWSPSNSTISGIVGTSRPIDFVLGDTTCRANLLNEKEIATIIREDGFRLWGNRTCSSDPKWAFLSVVRTSDQIDESIKRAHMWAVDQNLKKTYLDDVLESVNNYIRSLEAQGALLGGKAWIDPELNTPSSLSSGHVFIDYEFTPPAPAERLTFRSHLVDDYFKEVV